MRARRASVLEKWGQIRGGDRLLEVVERAALDFARGVEQAGDGRPVKRAGKTDAFDAVGMQIHSIHDAGERSSGDVMREFYVMRIYLCCLAIGLASALAFAGASRAASPADSDWPAYLGDKGRSLYAPLQQINRSNVAQLKVAWTYDTGDKGEYQANNLMIAGVLYTVSPTRKVIALDAATGREL